MSAKTKNVTKNSKPSESISNKGGTKEEVQIRSLKETADVKKLLKKDKAVIAKIAADILKNGFDDATPIVIDSDNNIIDGHQRVAAAKKAGLKSVPAVRRTFKTKGAVVEYAVRTQTARRNLSGGALLKLLNVVDKPKPKGGAQKPKAESGKAGKKKSGSSSLKTAKKLGVSKATVERARAVNKDTALRKKVEKEELTVNQAYKQLMAKKASPDAKCAKALKQAVKFITDCRKILAKCGKSTGENALLKKLLKLLNARLKGVGTTKG